MCLYGDSIAINDASCKTSELMIENNNIKLAKRGQVITCGRINGKIKPGDKIYRTVSIALNKEIEQLSNKENIKREIECKITIKTGEPIKLYIEDILTGLKVEKYGIVPNRAENQGIQEERIKEQLSKLGNTVFKAKDIKVELEPKVIFSISSINELRRTAIQELEEKIKETFIRKAETKTYIEKIESNTKLLQALEVSLCLNNMKESMDYEKIEGADNIYIPLRFFIEPKLRKQIDAITKKFNTYILMPTISKSNYEKINVDEILKRNIKGVVISNLSQIENFKNVEKIANYTLNITNNYTVNELKKHGITKFTTPPEFEKETLQQLDNSIKKETIVYGRTLLMTTEYCTIGTYNNCTAPCTKGVYKLKDRMGFEFPILTDRINCNNMIYNSKITSIEWKDLGVNSIRIDILEENIEEINQIIKTHKEGKRLEGKEYTNGNLNREV
ncbi:MAG: DUF3656 domain-containing protein [Clostridia bacterium]